MDTTTRYSLHSDTGADKTKLQGVREGTKREREARVCVGGGRGYKAADVVARVHAKSRLLYRRTLISKGVRAMLS